MSSNNNPPTAPVLDTELALEKLREYVAGALGLVIVVGMILICVIAIQNLPNAEQFQRVKDLLLIITPFVGVVIGYYFNKVTSDARAGALQRAADAASLAAVNASTESERAQAQAQTAQAQANQMRGALSEMVTAAESAGAGQPGNLGTLGAGDTPASAEAQIEFRVALERAKRALSNP